MGSLFCFCFTQFCHKMALPVSILTNRMRHWDAGYILYTIHLYTLHIKLIFTELGIGEVITRKVTMKVTRNLAVIRGGWCGISLPCMLAPMHAGAHMLNRSAILGFLYNKKLLFCVRHVTTWWQRSKNNGKWQKIHKGVSLKHQISHNSKKIRRWKRAKTSRLVAKVDTAFWTL